MRAEQNKTSFFAVVAFAAIVFLCLLTTAAFSATGSADDFDSRVVNDFLYYTGDGSGAQRNTARAARSHYPSATLAQLNVVRGWDDLSAQSREILSRYITLGPWRNGHRSVYSVAVTGCTEVLDETQDSYADSEHFRVIYTTSGQHAATSQYVSDVLSISEHIWDTEINQYGLPPPKLQDDNLYRVYICDLVGSGGPLGRTWTSDIYADDSALTYIEIDNDYNGITFNHGITLNEYVSVVQAHEFFHAIQFGISYDIPSSWLMEMSSVWMEDYVYPDVNDYVSEYLPYFFQSLDTSLGSESILMYGASIFMHHITENVADDNFVKTLWTTFKQKCIVDPSLAWCVYQVNEIPYIDELLQGYSTDIHDTFRDFNTSNYTKNYVDGSLDYFPDVTTKQVSGTETNNDQLDHLAAKFYKVAEPEASSIIQYDFSFQTQATDVEWRVSLVKESHTGAFTTENLTVTDGTASKNLISIGPNSDCDSFVVIVDNTSTEGNNKYYDLDFTRYEGPVYDLNHDFSIGWHLVGTPFNTTEQTAYEAFGVPSDTRIVGFADGLYSAGSSVIDPPGRTSAYWIYLEEPLTAVFTGMADSDHTISIKEGWNMVSLPADDPTVWDSSITVTIGQTDYALGSTEAGDCLDPVFYRYATDTVPPAFIQVSASDSYEIPSWEGFAIKAKTDCSLTFPQ